ncbi:MAG: GspH/FimT family pseudopilin [Halomonas sp.]|nr:GspH/FimT family pseudopilin [Halomonas sp.]MDN6297661.1 GspH/FimT family pseudopilin [Halomonas sp.]MDN6314999.1 GspH/FimT family pseudopilin [Halomonas sp.]MDN6336351.1 GspH/FimT family pseudopilin [Halomonas sp.]
MKPTTQQGVTLIELLVVITLVALLAGVGYPGLRAFGERNAHRVAVSQLQSALAVARHAAITRRTPVFLCPQAADENACGKDWSQALLVVAHATRPLEPANILRVLPRSDARITYNRGWRRVRFSSLGHSSGHNGTFTICADSTAPARGTALILSQLGRTTLENTACPGP